MVKRTGVRWTCIISLAVLFTSSSHGQNVKTEAGSFSGAGGKVSIEQDKGTLLIISGPEGVVSYRTEFLPAGYESDGGATPRVVVDKQSQKITIAAGPGWKAKTTLTMPPKMALNAHLVSGLLNVKGPNGTMDVSVDTGRLALDSSALPPDACVSAKAMVGSVRTPWGSAHGFSANVTPCERPTIRLHVRSGDLAVERP
ncbi:MAG: hypothetical protein HY552_04075 [Elusimicrobia bacterium]|nr:hypothetical protein [Elusimicrobiota bacterium]